MKYIRKIGILLSLLMLFGFSYGQEDFRAKSMKLILNKTTALADGQDEINITYRIEDDNGVPLRNIDKKEISLLIDGVESNVFTLRSNDSKIFEITLIYGDLKAETKVKFIKENKKLRIYLSKTRILADGIDEIIIGTTDDQGNKWNDNVTLYIDGEEIPTNFFKTKKTGEYQVVAKSGKFESEEEKITAYEKINTLNLKADKLNLLSNGVDKLSFTLDGKDQNGITRIIDNFTLVNPQGKNISKNKALTSKNPGTFKVRAVYKGEYSNYITYSSKSPKKFSVVSYYPMEETINLNTEIEVTLNIEPRDYKDSLEVFLDGKPVSGNLTYNKKSKSLTFIPDQPLKLNSKYEVRLKKSITGIDENKLKKDFTFEFETTSRKDIETVKVERGLFILGDETGKLWKFSSPTQEAFIQYDYFIGKTPVTFDIYDQYTRDMRLPLVDDNGWGRKTRPVINVTWNDTIGFLNWLSEKENLSPAYDKDGNLIDSDGNRTRDIKKVTGYRLPTEIEWEFAGKGGVKSKPTLFSGSNDVGAVSWYSDNSMGKTHEVATKMPNELGIYDMSGNIWEWINDNSGVYSGIERINSVGPKSGSLKILRGGSFNSIMSDSQLTFRDELSPNTKDIYYGFRVAKTIKEEK
ncbi:SUMF1/EgtB/PvdO family nonheme iron enzyme [Psychrilyobacter atlanticus]|uniref:SUMF1/EgtB/PvdO family nonheme iron enzyme n=1 Tax=Psychrilyobacter atlanticus TaxID=271091 RepID=UPI0003F832C8|nr:SUMF1/EgtB/PvdO family nonheme iron enzyme [Psychrilyobacter atlanticus]